MRGQSGAALGAETFNLFQWSGAQLISQRKDWFEKFERPYMALWWVPAGHIPTVAEAKQRLEHLQANGETAEAFTFRKAFPQPERVDG